ncbi:MAG: NAD(P)-dependent oxidoreductase [Patescibacteria group bacterium]
MPLNILVAEPGDYSAAALKRLADLGEVTWEKEHAADLPKIINEKNVSILVVRLAHKITRDLMAATPGLKIVGTTTTGLDHINLDAAKDLGIEVVSLKGEVGFLNQVYATAEHSFALLLALFRHVPQAHAMACRGEWVQDPLRGRELRDKTLGVLGVGRLGKMMIPMAVGFGMKVVAYDPNVPAEQIAALGAEPVGFGDVFSRADIVTIHVPLVKETENLVGEKEFAAMRPGSWLVNTSRGKIVDEKYLLAALESGHLAGAGLDVVTNEVNDGSMQNHPLIRYACAHGNLILSPHIAGTTEESLEKTQIFLANKLIQTVERLGLK